MYALPTSLGIYRFLGIVLVLAGLVLVFILTSVGASESLDAVEAVAIGGLALLLVGLGAVLGVVYPRRVARERADREARVAAHGGVPWAVREDWVRGEVSSRELADSVRFQVGMFALGAGGMAFLAWTSAWPVLVWGVLAGSLAVAVWLGLRISKQRAVGEARLQLATVPARPGSHVEGTLRLDTRLPNTDVLLRLDCLRRDVDYEGDVSWTSLWSEETSASPRRAGASVDVPVRIRLPRSVRSTSFDEGAVIDWKLTVRVGSGLTAPKLQFSIPVFAVAAEPRLARPVVQERALA